MRGARPPYPCKTPSLSLLGKYHNFDVKASQAFCWELLSNKHFWHRKFTTSQECLAISKSPYLHVALGYILSTSLWTSSGLAPPPALTQTAAALIIWELSNGFLYITRTKSMLRARPDEVLGGKTCVASTNQISCILAVPRNQQNLLQVLWLDCRLEHHQSPFLILKLRCQKQKMRKTTEKYDVDIVRLAFSSNKNMLHAGPHLQHLPIKDCGSCLHL